MGLFYVTISVQYSHPKDKYITMRFNEISEAKPGTFTQPTSVAPKTTQPVAGAPKTAPPKTTAPANSQATTQFASRDQIKQLAANLKQDMPDVRFEVENKSGLPYIRVFGSDKQTITNYLKQYGYENLPIEQKQLGLSSKYRSNILSYNADGIIYSMVVAGSGKKDNDDGTGVSVSIKEFTPTTLGLAGKIYNRTSLIKDTQAAVIARTKTRPELQQILLELIQVAAGGQPALTPEANANLSERARNQLSVDFGEILAPIKLAKGSDKIEFPKEGNFPLIDVIVGNNKYSVKSLTGSGTSFRSIQDLMDNFESSIGNDEAQEKLFSLFKSYHPKAGGKNVDKIIAGSNHISVPEYKKISEILGGDFTDYASLQSLLSKQKFAKMPNEQGYSQFLKMFYPAMVVGNWGKPVGLPADGNYYMGTSKGKEKPTEKEAGYPSFRNNPVKAATDILTYVMGVGTLNAVERGPDAQEYGKMMTNIVNQSPAWLGRLDITDSGQVIASAKPFTELQFKFQYHAPSHKPGNNLPGFMIIY